MFRDTTGTHCLIKLQEYKKEFALHLGGRAHRTGDIAVVNHECGYLKGPGTAVATPICRFRHISSSGRQVRLPVSPAPAEGSAFRIGSHAGRAELTRTSRVILGIPRSRLEASFRQHHTGGVKNANGIKASQHCGDLAGSTKSRTFSSPSLFLP